MRLNIATAKICNDYQRKASIYDRVKGHSGQDFKCPVNTQILSPITGEIVGFYDQKEMGWTLYVKHQPTDTIWVFAHLTPSQHCTGKKVKRGDVLCLSGRSGTKCGNTPHLHWEIIANRPMNKEDKIMIRKLWNWKGWNTRPQQYLLRLLAYYGINAETLEEKPPKPSWIKNL